MGAEIGKAFIAASTIFICTTHGHTPLLIVGKGDTDTVFRAAPLKAVLYSTVTSRLTQVTRNWGTAIDVGRARISHLRSTSWECHERQNECEQDDVKPQ